MGMGTPNNVRVNGGVNNFDVTRLPAMVTIMDKMAKNKPIYAVFTGVCHRVSTRDRPPTITDIDITDTSFSLRAPSAGAKK
jgi:hypothetical protein